jgi:hypothetical protein
MLCPFRGDDPISLKWGGSLYVRKCPCSQNWPKNKPARKLTFANVHARVCGHLFCEIPLELLSFHSFAFLDRWSPSRRCSHFCIPLIVGTSDIAGVRHCSKRDTKSWTSWEDTEKIVLNVRPHNSARATEFVDGKNFIRLPHPPNSPDVALLDFYFLEYLRKSSKIVLRELLMNSTKKWIQF